MIARVDRFITQLVQRNDQFYDVDRQELVSTLVPPNAMSDNSPTQHRALFRLVEKPEDFAGHMLAPRHLVVHDASRRRQDDISKLTRGQELDDPVLEVRQLDVEARADDTALIEAAVQLDNYFAGSVVINWEEVRLDAAIFRQQFRRAVTGVDSVEGAGWNVTRLTFLELANVACMESC